MGSRHYIDTSVTLTVDNFHDLPETRKIENPDLDPVPAELLPEDQVLEEVEYEPYEPTSELVEAVNVAIALGRPLLLQGDPGCGKTRLAYAVAYVLGMPLEVCPIKSTSRAQDLLYTYDAVRRLYDAQIPGGGQGSTDNNHRIAEQLEEGAEPISSRMNTTQIPRDSNDRSEQQSLDIHQYIRLGPLGRAIARAQYGRRSVVLIDEIDKADIDFPNDLLWELDRLEFKVTEAPDMFYAVRDPALRPIVFVTHNEEKALPQAFLRRCIFYHLKFPEDEIFLKNILKRHQVYDEKIGKRAIEILLRLRTLDLDKKPGLSELLDWVGYLTVAKTSHEEMERLAYIWALLKSHDDQERAKGMMRKS
jgi:MoxR-like ATPase